MTTPTITNRPTRSSVQVNCLRCGMADPPQLLSDKVSSSRSHQKAFQIWIPRFQNGALVAHKIYTGVAQHQKSRRGSGAARLTRLLRRPLTVAADRHDAIRGRIEAKVCQREGVLQAVGGQQRRNPLRVA